MTTELTPLTGGGVMETDSSDAMTMMMGSGNGLHPPSAPPSTAGLRPPTATGGGADMRLTVEQGAGQRWVGGNGGMQVSHSLCYLLNCFKIVGRFNSRLRVN